MTKKARPGDVQGAQGPAPASGSGSRAPKKDARRASKSKRPAAAPPSSASSRRSPPPPASSSSGSGGVPASSKRGRARRTGSNPANRARDALSANHLVVAPANESEVDPLAADRCAEHEAPLRPSEALRAAARAAAMPHPDDVSIPPASLGLDDLDAGDEHFFRQGELASQAAVDIARGRRPSPEAARLHASVLTSRLAARDETVLDFEEDFPDHRLIQLASPAARARRAQFAKYVKGGMAVAAMLCVAAFVRVTVAGPSRDSERNSATAGASGATQLEPLANAAERVPFSPVAPATAIAAAEIGARIPAPPPEPEPTVEELPVVEIAAEEKTADKPVEKVADKPVEKPAKTAAEEKRAARTLLERYDAKSAIAAGERSVALDPTDADAWLILGAAYQEVGQLDAARRAFQACVKQARRGASAECREMLQ